MVMSCYYDVTGKASSTVGDIRELFRILGTELG